MGVKVYVSGISGNKEVKKRQQRVFMILESKNIPFNAVDITEPGKESEKDFMQNNSKSNGATVSDTNPRHPLPPQIFNDEDYCGDYDQFDLANEIDTLEQFLKVEIPAQNNDVNSDDLPSVKKSQDKPVENNVDEIIERIATNGISSSRETSVESEKKSNGDDLVVTEVEETAEVENEAEPAAEAEVEAVAEAESEPEDEEDKETNPSEDLIKSERGASE